MAYLKYGIGGNEEKIEGSEGIADIPLNRTFLVEKLTKDAPANPEPVTGLETPDAVFKHYNPNLDISFENEEGQPVKENFAFSNVSDFTLQRMTERSTFLNELNTDKEFYNRAGRQLHANKVLARALSNSEAKKELVSVLQALKQLLVMSNQEDNQS